MLFKPGMHGNGKCVRGMGCTSTLNSVSTAADRCDDMFSKKRGIIEERNTVMVMHSFALLCIPLHSFALLYIALHCFAVLCIALHSFALLCIGLHLLISVDNFSCEYVLFR